jgi:hypothetical protein
VVDRAVIKEKISYALGLSVLGIVSLAGLTTVSTDCISPGSILPLGANTEVCTAMQRSGSVSFRRQVEIF